MDCEKFDRVVLDLLYGELDELTDAAARRHIEHCVRCKNILTGLRATREVGALELVEPPDGLELKILEAERRANSQLPLRKKVGRAVSILAVYAMRPQLTMAALLLLMIGSSLFFLRARPGDREGVLVTERGMQEAESEQVAIVPAPEAPAVAAAPEAKEAPARPTEEAPRRDRAAEEPRAKASPAGGPPALGQLAAEPAPDTATPEAGDDSLESAMTAYQSGRYLEAQRRFEAVAAQGGAEAPAAALHAVEALRRVRGCPAATAEYESVASRYPGTPPGYEAAWQAGDCYRALGDFERAEKAYTSLQGVAEYRSRVTMALAELAEQRETLARKAKAASAPAATPAPVPAKPASKN